MKVRNNILIKVEDSDIVNGTFIISNDITIIAYHCFSDVSELEYIIIPQNVTEIRTYAFENCSSLTRIEFKNKNCKLETGIFSNCYSLEKVILPENLKSIFLATF